MSIRDPDQTEVLYHQPGHLKGVTRILQIGEYVFTGGEDGRVCIWDAKLKEEIGCLYAHNTAISDIQKLNDENVIVTSSNDLDLRIWSLESFELLSSVKAHSSSIVGAKPWRNYVFSASRDQMLKKWKFEKGELVEDSRIKIPDIERFYICEDHIIVSNHYGLLSLYRTEDLTHVKYISVKRAKIIKAIKKASKNIEMFPRKDPHAVLLDLSRRYGIPSTVCKSTESYFILGHQFGFITLWNKDSKKLIDAFFSNAKHITGIEVVENQIITTSLDSSITIFDIDNIQLIKSIKLSARPLSLLVSEEGNLIIGLETGEILVLNQELKRLDKKTNLIPIVSSCISPEFLVIALDNGEILLIDNSRLLVEKRVKIHGKTPKGIFYYKDRIISVGEENKIHILDNELKILKTINYQEKPDHVKQAKHYITLTKNLVLDLKKDELMKGELSKQTKEEIEQSEIFSMRIINGDLHIVIKNNRLKERLDNANIQDDTRILSSISNLVESNKNAKYHKISPFGILSQDKHSK
ncbi:MAG: hypothetical protein ACXABK_01600 [Candidatus Heimdallarchaeaceae archaeon]